ncbi:unnamed protein product [Pleuronectes platessa]|uniref:Uncharacterized protein n=1 Tax=Pleuronectes platessa TaxID=8262 RepID=A0A9N7VMM6_PLEPL|nr:unnamed protein product [Pleuronectes platessa]
MDGACHWSRSAWFSAARREFLGAKNGREKLAEGRSGDLKQLNGSCPKIPIADFPSHAGGIDARGNPEPDKRSPRLNVRETIPRATAQCQTAPGPESDRGHTGLEEVVELSQQQKGRSETQGNRSQFLAALPAAPLVFAAEGDESQTAAAGVP